MNALRVLRITMAFLTSLLLYSCSSGSSDTSAGGGIGGTGSVAVLLADSPTDDYQNILLTINEVSLIPVNDGTPVVIFQSAAGLRVDLLEYQDEDYLLRVRRDVPAGQYSKIRLQVSAIEVTPKTGNSPLCDSLEIKLPSGKIDLNSREPFTVNPGGNLSIRLDIDANKSINLHQADEKCIFRPVVFVDIREGMPISRCPKILSGTIDALVTNGGGQVVGFTFNLGNSQGTVEVRLLENVAIVGALGECKTPMDLKVGDEVRVRGRLANDLVFEASNIVIGQLLAVTGTVDTAPVFSDSTFTFTFTPSGGQALVGGQYTVQGQACTLVLIGCDTNVNPTNIKAGMTVKILGKLVSENQSTVLRAAAIILKAQVAGSITTITPSTGGQNVTIDQSGGLDIVNVFIPDGTPIYLEGDSILPANLWCVGREVRVLLNPDNLSPFTANLVKVMSETKAGTVKAIDVGNRTLTVDLNGVLTTVNVSSGATILKSIADVQDLILFGDIKVNDYIVYFGLTGCDTDATFYAYVVIVIK